MDLSFFRDAELVLLPPAGPMALMAMGLVWRRRMTLFVVAGFLTLYVSSISVTTRYLSAYLETYPPADPKNLKAETIVVLGSTLYGNSPEYGRDSLANLVLERVRYAAWLHKQTQIPILTSGGTSGNNSASEAATMRKVLQQEFGAQVSWIENQSRNTFENARNSARILKSAGIEKIALVTHAYHVPRALEAFEYHGMTVTPAPTIFYGNQNPNINLTEWIPSSRAMFRNRMAMHEIFGRWYYKFQYYTFRI